ncbi:phosphotransferase family protein [Ruania albidiflava]|uniref:phosphotransferase family protein n=1 Tax=Ruania albidiflava TaxID=366586 RepID=UPI0003B77F23|nr:aminoglycoside phosphotransferase family protein [Ruania albidiflava]
MPAQLHRVAAAVAAEGLTLVKAIPRSATQLGLELRRPDGGLLAGQWFADRDEARAVHAQTVRAAPAAGVQLLPGGTLLQPGGADRKLPGLPGLAAAEGANLVAHRPEQRAVVRLSPAQAPTTYVKLVRPRRLARTVTGARLTVAGVATPAVQAVDERAGRVTFAELRGRTLYDLLGDPTSTDADLTTVSSAVGGAIRHLHTSTVAAPLPSHDAAAEVDVARRWIHLATEHQVLGQRAAELHRLLDQAAERLAAARPATALLHRDLHDKQLLLDGTDVGLLDFDLAAFGDPALDVANLLTHLQLRSHQGRCSNDRARTCATAVLQGYGHVPGDWQRRLEAYRTTARVRLVCVYAFRPAHSAAKLLHIPTEPVAS